MLQHRRQPVQWQLGGRLGPGAPAPESWSVSRLVACAGRPRGIGITAGGPSAPIRVRPEFAIGIGRVRLPRRRHHTKSPRTARCAGLCTKGRRWRLGWLVYAPEGPPSAWAGPCRFSRCQNSRKCTFPLNRVKLACCFAKKVSPRDPLAFPRALVWPSGLSNLPHGLSPARRRLEGWLLKIARVCA